VDRLSKIYASVVPSAIGWIGKFYYRKPEGRCHLQHGGLERETADRKEKEVNDMDETNSIGEKLEKIEKRLRAIERRVPKLTEFTKASLEFQQMRLALDVAATSKDVEEARQRIAILKELVKEMREA